MRLIAFSQSVATAVTPLLAWVLFLWTGSQTVTVVEGQAPQCFCSTCNTALRNAVTDWISNGREASNASDTYGANISNWCVNEVTNFKRIFYNKTSFNEVLNWNTSSATITDQMFSYATSFNKPLNFDVRNVIDMYRMFDQATKFTGVGLEKWNTANLKNLSSTFRNAKRMKANLSTWDVSKVADMRETFRYASAFNVRLCPWGEMLNSSLLGTRTGNMFQFSGCPEQSAPILTANPISPLCYKCTVPALQPTLNPTLQPTFKPATLQPSQSSFRGTCFQNSNSDLKTAVTDYISQVQNLTELSDKLNHSLSVLRGYPIGHWCTINITDFSLVFSGKKGFNEPLTYWQLDNAINTKGMFLKAESFDQPLEHFNMSNVKDASNMFREAKNFTGVGLENWDMSSNIYFNNMFQQAEKFNRNVSNWNVAKGVDFNNMFDTAITFDHDLSKWNPVMAVKMKEMFNKANKYNKSLCAWGRKLTNITDFTRIFYYTGCQFAFMEPTYDNRWVLPTEPAGPFCMDCGGRYRTRPSLHDGLYTLPLVPTAMTIRHDNVIVAWSGDEPYNFDPPGSPLGGTYTTTFNPDDKTDTGLVKKGHRMFCPGTSMLADGRIMITGGLSGKGVTLYNPFNNSWTTGTQLKVPRGYHSQITLGDGRVFTVGGSWAGEKGGKYAEIYTPSTNAWTSRSGILPVENGSLVTKEVIYRSDNHMWLFEAPSGLIFHAGPSITMNWINITGNLSFYDGDRTGDIDSMNGCAAMFDINKIIKFGGAKEYAIVNSPSTNSAYIIDISSSKANVTRLPDSFWPRVMHNIVLLPNGHVVLIGGQRLVDTFKDHTSVMYIEVFDPYNKTYYDLEHALLIPRPYHSAALLLKDGRFIVGGGGLCYQNCDAYTSYNHPNVEIITPSYLLSAPGQLATRPVIESGPSDGLFVPLTNITVTMNTNETHTFALMRLGTATHSVNLDQRRVPLAIALQTQNTFTLAIPGWVHVPPGLYWLFAMNEAGVPSIGFNLRRP